MKRIYDTLVEEHCKSSEEMLFLTGPRQVGKTTVSKNAKHYCNNFIYLNWDNEDHRNIILSGPSAIIKYAGIDVLSESKPIIVFDEIHKHPDWKNFLKGFYDSYMSDVRIIVSGSARLDVYKHGGDSLMGRYFPWRMHPLSVAECLYTDLPHSEIRMPREIPQEDFIALLTFGGFPKPFITRERQFAQRWKNLRTQQLIQEDIRDVKIIHDLNGLKMLVNILRQQVAGQMNYSTLAKHIRVSVDTIRRWIDVLETFYYCYRVRPWSKNISRSLIKEPKLFLWDWSQVNDAGARAENFVGSHLLKSVQFWTDYGLGEYDLFYIRTLDKQEVDFVVTKNGTPWFLVEVKLSDGKNLSHNLAQFQEQTGALHAFQVVLDMPYVAKNCFERTKPVIVSAKTFLSQLV